MQNFLLIELNRNRPFSVNALIEDEYRVRQLNGLYSVPAHVKEFSPDIIAVNLEVMDDAMVGELNGLTSQNSVPVMVYAAECDTAFIVRLISAEVSFLSVGGLPDCRINQHIAIAFARFNRMRALKNALDEARTQLEDRKQIDRAKAILIKARQFSEDEAYHTLRKLAMGRNITLGEMARNVIAMADLLK